MNGSEGDRLVDVVRECCALPSETEWFEFKVNQAEPREIGEYISALANAAALEGRPQAYVIWGVRDTDHAVVGTTFRPSTTRQGQEPLESWLLRLLEPKLSFQFSELTLDGRRIVVLEIAAASHQPVRFSGEEFIRLGAQKKKLRDIPAKEARLWQMFSRESFEQGIAAERVTADDVLQLLDYPAYFELLQQPLPAGRDQILDTLNNDRLLKRSGTTWNVLNIGAALLARRLDAFPGVKRKMLRIIQYQGGGRVDAQRELVEPRGYAAGFESVITYINGLVPANEVIGRALRTNTPMFPERAIRELVANALIHQDFTVAGTGPTVEIFADRIEITNPGAPLIAPHRFLDSPPRSRNESLASLMRRFRICEERGSGIDKVLFDVEFYQLPAPIFESPDGFTRATLFAHRPLGAMDREDRVRACYLHACLRYVMREPMTNATLRARFGIAAQNIAAASRLLKEAVEAGAIVISNPEEGQKRRRYIPFWAAPTGNGFV